MKTLLIFTILSISIFSCSIAYGVAGSEVTPISQKNLELDKLEKKSQELNEIQMKISNAKSDAYDKAINELKLWVTALGILFYITLIGFGIIKKNDVRDVKEEIRDYESKLREEARLRIELEIGTLQRKVFDAIEERIARNVIPNLDSMIDVKVSEAIIPSINKIVDEILSAREISQEKRSANTPPTAPSEEPIDTSDPFRGGDDNE